MWGFVLYYLFMQAPSLQHDKRIWFAKRPNGEIIPLTAKEFWLFTQENNHKHRMRFTYIGTSDGKVYEEKMKEAVKLYREYEQAVLDAQALPKSQRIKVDWHQLTEQEKDDWIVDGNTAENWKGVLTSPQNEALESAEKLKKASDEAKKVAFDLEVEEARKNGVQPVDPYGHIITMSEGANGGSVAGGQQRNKIISGM